MSAHTPSPNEPTNGAGSAAVLAAGIGAFTIMVLDLAADKVAAIKSIANFYKPTGTLSGVTTIAILVWLACWVILDWRWKKQEVAAGQVCAVALVLLVLSLVLTFPPIADLL